MSLLSGFDATTVEPRESFQPIPAGDYTVCISASEEKTTASGNGVYLKLTLEVLDGDHKGRLLFENLNLKNPSAAAVDIARRTARDICLAVNVPQLNDGGVMELHGKPMLASVKVEKRNDNGELRNVIKSFAPVTAANAAPAATGQPWAKKS
jgi:hypothetical protein